MSGRPIHAPCLSTSVLTWTILRPTGATLLPTRRWGSGCRSAGKDVRGKAREDTVVSFIAAAAIVWWGSCVCEHWDEALRGLLARVHSALKLKTPTTARAVRSAASAGGSSVHH